MTVDDLVVRLRDVADSAVNFGIYENEVPIWRAAAAELETLRARVEALGAEIRVRKLAGDEIERLRGDVDQALRRAESAERLCGDYIARMERMKELVCSDCAQLLGGQGK